MQPYNCKTCDMKFIHASRFQIHVFTHTGYKCDLCYVALIQLYMLKKHKLIHVKSVILANNLNMGDKTHKCYICVEKCAHLDIF